MIEGNSYSSRGRDIKAVTLKRLPDQSNKTTARVIINHHQEKVLFFTSVEMNRVYWLKAEMHVRVIAIITQ